MVKNVINREFWFKHITGDFSIYEKDDGAFVCEVNVNELPDLLFDSQVFDTVEDALRWATDEINSLEADYS